jgi:ABC-type amino acid transport substrate-binding protein
MKKLSVVAAGAALAAIAVGPAQAGKTLDTIKQRGQLICGVSQSTAGFSRPNNQGAWEGLDVDFCKAVAVAILGDATKVRYVATTSPQRFPALQSGEVDVLSRNTTATLTRDTVNGFNFAPVTYYDGQGFMVPKKLGVKSAKELNGATVCVSPGTTTELNLADYFRAQKMQFKPVVIEKADEIKSAYFSGRCDVYTTDASGLASLRAVDAPVPDDHIILPEIISKEPLGPGRAPWRRGVRRHRALVGLCHDRGRRAGDQLQEPRPDAEERRPRHQALPRRHPRQRQGARDRREVRPEHRQAGRQLCRDLRAPCRQGHAAQARARPERPVDPRRPAVRAAVPVIAAVGRPTIV